MDLASRPSLQDGDSSSPAWPEDLVREDQQACAPETPCCLVPIDHAGFASGKFTIDQGCLSVGRDSGSDIVIRDQNASRKHAQLVGSQNGYTLKDLSSANGSFVNEFPVSNRLLKSGDIIRFGNTRFCFLSDSQLSVAYHETVYRLATRDLMTGTYSEHYFRQALDREFSRTVRHNVPLSLMILEVDHAAGINERFGRVTGYQVMAECARRMLKICREEDIVARLDDSTFGMILTGPDADQAPVVADQCVRIISDEPFDVTDGPLLVTASSGHATLNPASPISLQALLRRVRQQLKSDPE